MVLHNSILTELHTCHYFNVIPYFVNLSWFSKPVFPCQSLLIPCCVGDVISSPSPGLRRSEKVIYECVSQTESLSCDVCLFLYNSVAAYDNIAFCCSFKWFLNVYSIFIFWKGRSGYLYIHACVFICISISVFPSAGFPDAYNSQVWVTQKPGALNSI